MMIIYQALSPDWAKDFQLTFRIYDGNLLSRINTRRDGFEKVTIREDSHYLTDDKPIYKG